MNSSNNQALTARELTPKPDDSYQLESLQLVRTGYGPRLFGVLLFILWVVAVCFFAFVPWRQSVAGHGEIVVFSPKDRPQTIEAQISGRLIKWYVRDGEQVTAGQPLAELQDIDPRYLDKTQLETMQKQRQALLAKREALSDKASSLSHQIDNLGEARGAAVPAAKERIGQAKDRLFAARQSVEVAEQNIKTTQWQLDRVSVLYDKGLRSQRDQQVALLENTRAKTELQRARAAYDVVSRDTGIAGFDLAKLAADTKAHINSIHAALADVHQLIATTDGEINKLDIDLQNMTGRIAQRSIKAPCGGRVVRLNRVGSGETVSAGSTLATIVPDTMDRAAAILIRDYDAPLVTIGSPVRLAISGWPSLQFVGWPSVAVGTFAGRVAVIDAVDDGKHYYRIIVVPDFAAIKSKKEEPWPSPKILRPGAQTTGWVLLNDVPVWFELWRQFNGFQPTVHAPAPDGEQPRVK
ncbi:MAG: biotin/lipoyl-binding protein [Candidatus Obscuribacter sp.]|nr:biotin/lipoyl-binding protein [Candidatus Obscuribacter sp.]MBP6351020.1 biotin/lipoyl-binding protein [Candidatus Obscuribacter sp.]